MNEYETLSKRVDSVEQDVRDIRELTTDLRENSAKSTVILEQCSKTNEKLCTTMEHVTESMSEMTQSLKDSNKRLESFEEKLNDTNTKMDEKFKELREDVELVDGKGKIDVLEWIKNNWIVVVVGLLAVAQATGLSLH